MDNEESLPSTDDVQVDGQSEKQLLDAVLANSELAQQAGLVPLPDEEIVEDPAAQQLAIGHAVQGDAPGHAQVLATRDLTGVARLVHGRFASVRLLVGVAHLFPQFPHQLGPLVWRKIRM